MAFKLGLNIPAFNIFVYFHHYRDASHRFPAMYRPTQRPSETNSWWYTLSDNAPGGSSEDELCARPSKLRDHGQLFNIPPISSQSAAEFARLYKLHDLQGGHII